jgi:uncharacterized protein (TIGR02145 family)
MKFREIILVLILSYLIISLHSCKSEEIILHGEISGLVTDTLTNQPLQAVAVKLNPLDDTTSTGNDGKYLFKSLIPGDYDIEVSKKPYAKGVRSVTVTSANTSQVNVALHKIQDILISETHLDFGFDSTQKSFIITNTGIGKLNYSITTSQDWITVNPNIGEITVEPQMINLTIDRTGLSEKKHVEWVELVFHVGRDLVQDTVYVLLNGIMDQDKNYYGTVIIGTQTWLSENLNTGSMILNGSEKPKDNGKIEKYCYGDDKSNCNIYGGLYSWREAMQYHPSDDGEIGTTQGICPVGWHIPTQAECYTLISSLGGSAVAGGKLKETGTAHWLEPNPATNESDFSLLPGGLLAWNNVDTTVLYFVWEGVHGYFQEATLHYYPNSGYESIRVVAFNDNTTVGAQVEDRLDFNYSSVRCIKDPLKNK